MSETLVRVTCDGPRPFCAGLILRGDRCVEAAPILRRAAMGKTAEELRAIFVAKGWTATKRVRPRPADIPCDISWRGSEMLWRWTARPGDLVNPS